MVETFRRMFEEELTKYSAQEREWILQIFETHNDYADYMQDLQDKDGQNDQDDQDGPQLTEQQEKELQSRFEQTSEQVHGLYSNLTKKGQYAASVAQRPPPKDSNKYFDTDRPDRPDRPDRRDKQEHRDRPRRH